MKCDIVASYVQGRPPVSEKRGFLEGFLPHHKPSPLISPAANTSTIGHTGTFHIIEMDCWVILNPLTEAWDPVVRVALRSVSSVGLKPYMCRHSASLRLAIIIYILCSRLLLSLFGDPKCCTIVCQWIRCGIICNVMPRLIWQNRTTILHCQWNIALRSPWLLAMMIQLSRRSKAFSVHSLLQVKLFKYLCFSAI